MQAPSPIETPCPCCDSLAWADRWEGFLLCRTCGLMTVDRRHGAEQLRELYGERYFRGEEYTDYLADKDDYQRTLADHLRSVGRYVPAGRRILEIGCAYGFFLELIRRRYPGSLGVDISADAVRFARARGLDAVAGDLLRMDLPGAFDAVCLWDTVEHLAQPVAMIAKAAEHLRPGGHLFLTTGDFGALLPRLQGLRWRQIHPPTHLFYFTRPSLSAMCRKLGFDVVSFATVTVNLRLRSALLNLHRIRPQTLAGRLAKRACRALPRFLLEACFPFNLGDTVLLVARRRG